MELELVQSLEIEGEAPALAVDLEAVAVLAARGEARGLEAAERTVREAKQCERGVVDADRRGAPAVLARSLAHEGLEQRRDLGDLADEHAREIDDVRAEIA
jgi:hypothetical protein